MPKRGGRKAKAKAVEKGEKREAAAAGLLTTEYESQLDRAFKLLKFNPATDQKAAIEGVIYGAFHSRLNSDLERLFDGMTLAAAKKEGKKRRERNRKARLEEERLQQQIRAGQVPIGKWLFGHSCEARGLDFYHPHMDLSKPPPAPPSDCTDDEMDAINSAY